MDVEFDMQTMSEIIRNPCPFHTFHHNLHLPHPNKARIVAPKLSTGECM